MPSASAIRSASPSPVPPSIPRGNRGIARPWAKPSMSCSTGFRGGRKLSRRHAPRGLTGRNGRTRAEPAGSVNLNSRGGPMSTQDAPADIGRQPANRDDAIDLSSYLARIGYTGPLRPTPDVLAGFIERHMATIPFEAIDVMLGRGINLSPESVDGKLLAKRRGGYCFEHQNLLRRALVAIGFPVERLLARVRVRETPDGSAPPATHASLKVEAGGRFWLADVGFGSFMPNVPLAWEVGAAQETRFGTFRIRDTDDGQLIETLNDDGWSPLYEILRFRWQSVDFEVANHYVAHHPSSLFRSILIAARTELETRYTLMGNRLTIHSAGGSREERLLDADGIATALGTIFGLPVEPEWRPLIERAAALPG